MTQKPAISVVVPVFNEENTLTRLLDRINTTLNQASLSYEVIVIDDHSSDNSFQLLQKLAQSHPLILEKKTGKKRGKAHSLLQGFRLAQADVVVTIDADLQYPPEVLPEMWQEIVAGADVVVAERSTSEASWGRKITGSLFRFIFAKLMHGIDEDAQSGLKMMRSTVLRRIKLTPTADTFDIELLLKAKHAGYKISYVPIHFKKRSNRSRVNIFGVGLKASHRALALKLSAAEVFPFLPETREAEGLGFHHKGQKYIPHSSLKTGETALFRFARNQKFFFVVLFLIVGAGLVWNWHQSLVLMMAILTFLYFADLLFNMFLIFRSFYRPPEIRVSAAEISAHEDRGWPTYTIFCPLYKEPEVIPQFVAAISKMDYPSEKLQVMLLLEADDTKTIAAAQNVGLPPYIEIVIVPPSLPKTKPKACNYGLLKARGEYCVIYDAEDVPDRDQLKKAVVAFEKGRKNIACVQAKLNFYNPHQNLLTRAFTAEYSLWFDLVLTGLQSINAPIPLGGTSNHFRTAQLREHQGWDAFNVTEDCDLGIRLVKRGFYTAVLDSTTLEEANSGLFNWFSQRSRWIKGYMQTYLVHMRRPGEFLRSWKEPHAITFQLVVGGKILSMFINPLMWALTISYFAFRSVVGPTIESFFPSVVFYMAIFSLIIGNFLYAYYYMIGCAKRDQDELIKYVFLVPLYWLAMSIAAWIAVRDLIVRPHHWAKTKHGLHLHNKKATAQMNSKIAQNARFA